MPRSCAPCCGAIDKLLLSKLPEVLSADQKASKVHNLLTSLSGKRIQNVGTRQVSKWVLMAPESNDEVCLTKPLQHANEESLSNSTT